eukprot:5949096-Pyramimonas_sp.AAC.1
MPSYLGPIVSQVAFNPKDTNTFASASLDRTIKVWSLGQTVSNFTLEGHETVSYTHLRAHETGAYL